MINSEIVVNLILIIACLGLIISSAEDIYSSKIFDVDELLSWEVLKYSKKSMYSDPFWVFISKFFREPVFKSILWIRLVTCSILLLVCFLNFGGDFVRGFLIVLILAISIFLSLRSIYGLDGAHQMNIIILFGLTFYFLQSENTFGRDFSLFFIAGQSLSSYFLAGAFKLKGHKWRNGTAISGIMTTKIYGHSYFGQIVMRNPMICYFLSWGTICFELFFIFSVVCDPIVLYAFLILGFLFHSLNCLLMGLNGFLYAFVATYPAIIYLSHYLTLLIY